MQRHAEQSAQHASLTRELKTMLEAETRKAAAAEAASAEAKERLSIGQEEMERGLWGKKKKNVAFAAVMLRHKKPHERPNQQNGENELAGKNTSQK